MNALSPSRSTRLQSMLADIHAAVLAGNSDSRPGKIAGALAPYLRCPDLLSAIACDSCPTSYIRHLLHADQDEHYAVVALVWRPGQMSPVHAHRTWCALGIHQGVLTEAFYTRSAVTGQPTQTAAVLRACGDTSHGPADPDLIHRLANLGMGEAVSIHVYGADFDRFGSDVNQVYE